MATKIPWATETWNPFHGCTPVSAGCAHCYAKPFAKRLAGAGIKGYDKKDPFAVTLHPHKLDEPYHWRKPRLVFVGSLGDMFHQSISTSHIEQMFKVMEECPRHIFQVLTKRPTRMAQYANRDWPKNVWLGISVEDDRVDERLRYIRPWDFGSPGLPCEPRKFLSWEPAIGDVQGWYWRRTLPDLNWLVIGCESGPKRRPFENRWAVLVIEECRALGVPVYVKQIPVKGKVSKDPGEWPEELQVQEYPDAMKAILEAGSA